MVRQLLKTPSLIRKPSVEVRIFVQLLLLRASRQHCTYHGWELPICKADSRNIPFDKARTSNSTQSTRGSGQTQKKRKRLFCASRWTLTKKLAEIEKLLNVNENSVQPTTASRVTTETGDVERSAMLSQLPAGCKPCINGEGEEAVASSSHHTLADVTGAIAPKQSDSNTTFGSSDSSGKWIHLDQCHSLLKSINH